MKRFLCVVLLLSAAGLLAARREAPAGPANSGQAAWFSRLTVGSPIHQGNLTIFPVFAGSAADASRFLTLDEGLSQGVVKVGEFGALRGVGRMMRPQPDQPRSQPWPEQPPYGRPIPRPAPDEARVNELAIQNLSDRPLILLAGEIVTGGKQDRVVGRDRIVPPHSEPISLDVFCVEPGRWRGLSAQFAQAKSMAHPRLRQEVTEARDQQKVWNEVAESRRDVVNATAMAPGVAGASPGVAGGQVGGVVGGIMSSTTSYAQTVQAAPVQKVLADQQRELARRIPANAVGLVIAVDGKVAWADVFTSPALFARYRDKLLQSYAVEATRSAGKGPGAVQESEAADFLRPLSGRQTTEMEPQTYRLTRTEASGTVTYELEALDSKTLDLHMARMAR